ncbi:hypothetical protein G4Z16_24015 [Streptomyces bathyalis]|uniref:Uncharacterized protein n=1 Tax=Streptomyces bathyalis TaxID=2710756 RepID=A0A7T1WTU4_9ACTN|nr:hypothetical protein [Streptomyces bathyalis]QPP08966.1 hypothetical protein G4Z16_24015 [Streptomyces bathyalis]
MTDLREALAAHGITLPSITVELPAFAAEAQLPLMALGNCNVDPHAGWLLYSVPRGAGKHGRDVSRLAHRASPPSP